MKTLTRYLLKDTLKPALLALVLLSSIIWLMQSLRFMDYIVNQGLPLRDFFWMIALVMPYMLIAVIPLSVFAGAVYAFKRLNDDNEVHSLFAAGLSKWTVLWPSIVVAFLASIVCYITALFLIPAGMSTLKTFQNSVRDGGGNFLLEERTFNPIGQNLMVYIQQRLGPNRIQGIMVHDNTQKLAPVTWMAEEGRLSSTAEGMPQLQLINGSRQEIGKNQSLNVLEFKSHTVDLLTPTQKAAKRTPRPRELFMGELLLQDGQDKATLQKYKAEFHKRLLWPLAPFVYVLIAASILIKEKRRRTGAGKSTAVAVGAVFTVQALLLTAHNLASKGNTLVLYGQWAMMAILILTCIVVLSSKPMHEGK